MSLCRRHCGNFPGQHRTVNKNMKIDLFIPYNTHIHTNYGVSFTILWVTLHIQHSTAPFPNAAKSAAIDITELKVTGSSLLELWLSLLLVLVLPLLWRLLILSLFIICMSHTIYESFCLRFEYSIPIHILSKVWIIFYGLVYTTAFFVLQEDFSLFMC